MELNCEQWLNCFELFDVSTIHVVGKLLWGTIKGILVVEMNGNFDEKPNVTWEWTASIFRNFILVYDSTLERLHNCCTFYSIMNLLSTFIQACNVSCTFQHFIAIESFWIIEATSYEFYYFNNVANLQMPNHKWKVFHLHIYLVLSNFSHLTQFIQR